MGFYGKIYEQAVNIFNRLRFKNTNDTQFPEDNLATDEFVVRADGGDAAATIAAGNKWIQFTKEGDLDCKIYHAKSNLELNSDIMTLSGEDNVINYGDIITIHSPIFDESGHVIRYESKEFRMVVIENFEDIETAINDIANLKNAVGEDIENYTGDAILVRLETIDTNLATTTGTATKASETATAANIKAQQALDTVDSAKEAAEKATTAADNANAAATAANENLKSLQAKIQILNDELLDLKGRVAQLEGKDNS